MNPDLRLSSNFLRVGRLYFSSALNPPYLPALIKASSWRVNRTATEGQQKKPHFPGLFHFKKNFSQKLRTPENVIYQGNDIIQSHLTISIHIAG